MIQHKGAALGFQPRIRKGAFFEACWRYGCRNYSVYNRTYISSFFTNPVDEYWHVINHVALWPVMGERQVEITGPSAKEFVQLLTPRNMDNCAIGQCKYALLTAPDGGIVCDPIILHPEAGKYWLSTSDCDLELWTKGIAVNAGLEVTIRDAEVSVLQVQGPKSPALMVDLVGEAILDLKYYWSASFDFQGTELVISRTGWSGEFSYEIYLADETKGDALFDALMEKGKIYNVAPGSVSQARRIESGILSWGLDISPETNPYEVGLGHLVGLKNPADFIGKKALSRLKHEPLTKKLVGLIVEGEALASNETIWPLMIDGKQIGKLTSLGYSPRLEKNLAIAIVDIADAQVGTLMSVETWDRTRTAVVSSLPFVEKRQMDDPRALFTASR